MSDLDTLKQIARECRVPPEESGNALARIRALLGNTDESGKAQRTERAAKTGRDRQEKGGRTRAEE